MSDKINKAIKLKRGSYIYRGYYVVCIGYHQPDHHIVWEAVDEYGFGFAHSYSLKNTKRLVDYEIKEGLKEEGILTKENISKYLHV